MQTSDTQKQFVLPVYSWQLQILSNIFYNEIRRYSNVKEEYFFFAKIVIRTTISINRWNSKVDNLCVLKLLFSFIYLILFILNSHHLTFIYLSSFYISFIYVNLKVDTPQISWKASIKIYSLGSTITQIALMRYQKQVKHRLCWLTYVISEGSFFLLLIIWSAQETIWESFQN